MLKAGGRSKKKGGGEWILCHVDASASATATYYWLKCLMIGSQSEKFISV